MSKKPEQTSIPLIFLQEILKIILILFSVILLFVILPIICKVNQNLTAVIEGVTEDVQVTTENVLFKGRVLRTIITFNDGTIKQFQNRFSSDYYKNYKLIPKNKKVRITYNNHLDSIDSIDIIK